MCVCMCVCVCCVCVYVVYLCNVYVCVHTQHSSIAASSPGSVHGVHISRFLPVPFIQLGILVAAIFAASLGPFIYQVCPTSHSSLPSQPHLMTCPMPGFFPTGTVEAGFVPPFPFQERSVPRLLGTQLLGSVQSAGQAADISWYRRGQVETGGGGGGRWRQEGKEGTGGGRKVAWRGLWPCARPGSHLFIPAACYECSWCLAWVTLETLVSLVMKDCVSSNESWPFWHLCSWHLDELKVLLIWPQNKMNNKMNDKYTLVCYYLCLHFVAH